MNRRPDETPPVRHLRNQAKKLLKSVRAGDATALARVARFRRDDPGSAGLMQVQHVLAQELGFRTWAAMVSCDPVELQRRVEQRALHPPHVLLPLAEVAEAVIASGKCACGKPFEAACGLCRKVLCRDHANGVCSAPADRPR